MSASALFLGGINGILWLIALLLFVPIAVLFIECWVAWLPPRQRWEQTKIAAPKLAILMPAHDEAAGIRPVLEGLKGQLKSADRLVVIADNCTDNTAEVARSTGATVIERKDPTRRGKGYALDFGMKFLAADPPDVVVIMDADCVAEPGTIDRIGQKAMILNRPVQAIYLMERPAQPKPKDAVSALAFMVKNLVRPRGLEWFGLPCPLTGTGMAFPWQVIRSASLASGNIVEDMQLGVDLAIDGYAPSLCTDAKVKGLLPQQEKAAKSQRTRWEHGHLQTLLTQVPRLLQVSLQQRRLDLFMLALDLAIPPLSLLVMLWLVSLLVTAIAGLMGLSWLPAMFLGMAGILLLIAIVSAWFKFGRADLPALTLLAVPFYVLWKIPLYLAFLVRRQKKWVKTERDAV
ncbi:MAG TPA: glycosyltransferase family 2 protein [Trichocoleus sp.]